MAKKKRSAWRSFGMFRGLFSSCSLQPDPIYVEERAVTPKRARKRKARRTKA